MYIHPRSFHSTPLLRKCLLLGCGSSENSRTQTKTCIHALFTQYHFLLVLRTCLILAVSHLKIANTDTDIIPRAFHTAPFLRKSMHPCAFQITIADLCWLNCLNLRRVAYHIDRGFSWELSPQFVWSECQDNASKSVTTATFHILSNTSSMRWCCIAWASESIVK
jgi:hypothetical protein